MLCIAPSCIASQAAFVAGRYNQLDWMSSLWGAAAYHHLYSNVRISPDQLIYLWEVRTPGLYVCAHAGTFGGFLGHGDYHPSASRPFEWAVPHLWSAHL